MEFFQKKMRTNEIKNEIGEIMKRLTPMIFSNMKQ